MLHAELRVLMLGPADAEAELVEQIATGQGLAFTRCDTIDALCHEIGRGAGLVVLRSDGLALSRGDNLAQCFEDQPRWSDLPVLLLIHRDSDPAVTGHIIDVLSNVVLLEHPLREATLASAIRTATRARQRQYQLRDHMGEREDHFRAQALLAAIVSSSDDAIISKTLQGRILSWNHGAERLFGYTAAETIGQPINMLIPEERQHEEPALLERLGRGERIDHFETVRLTKSGRRIAISLTVSPLRDANGTVIGASKVARDITERLEAEAMLREGDRRKDEFLAVLAHELRNPLAPIRNSLHILRHDALRDPTVVQVGEMMERQVNHMVRLVDDLLEVSRITRGKIELRIEALDLAAVVHAAIETSQPLITAAGHRLTLDLPPEPLAVHGDPVRLAQIFTNVLNNAAKYTNPDGQIHVAVARDGDKGLVTVRDNGIGIAPELLPTVFDLFAQIHPRSEQTHGGLGIGLTLARGLVEMHGGSISVASEGVGRGCEFHVRFPLALALTPSGKPPAISATAISVSPSRRILVVDDNRDAAESLTLLLRLEGADAEAVFSGEEALAAFAVGTPDVVLLDIGMPSMNGHEVAAAIRQLPGTEQTTLIALTGWGQERDRVLSQEAGFDYHLVKPADINTLRSLLNAIDHRPDLRRVQTG